MKALKADFSLQKKILFNANLFGNFQNQKEIQTVKELLLELDIVADYLPPEHMKSVVLQSVNININHLPTSEVMIQKRIQSRYDRPFLTVSFMGSSETAGALRDVGMVMGLRQSETERVIRQGLAFVTNGINHYGAELYRKKAYLLLNGYYSEIIGRILDDLGMVVVSPPDKTHYPTPEALQHLIKECGIDLIVGDDNQVFTNTGKTPYLSLSNVNESFLCFKGFINLAHCITRVIKENH